MMQYCYTDRGFAKQGKGTTAGPSCFDLSFAKEHLIFFLLCLAICSERYLRNCSDDLCLVCVSRKVLIDLQTCSAIPTAPGDSGTCFSFPFVFPFVRHSSLAILDDDKADLWSAGAVLYELVTAKHPFGGTNQVATFERNGAKRGVA